MDSGTSGGGDTSVSISAQSDGDLLNDKDNAGGGHPPQVPLVLFAAFTALLRSVSVFVCHHLKISKQEEAFWSLLCGELNKL